MNTQFWQFLFTWLKIHSWE